MDTNSILTFNQNKSKTPSESLDEISVHDNILMKSATNEKLEPNRERLSRI